jgi:hypothetical protein
MLLVDEIRRIGSAGGLLYIIHSLHLVISFPEILRKSPPGTQLQVRDTDGKSTPTQTQTKHTTILNPERQKV